MPRSNRPGWQLPRGVTRGLWDYVNSDVVANDYDDYFAYNKLFELDNQFLEKHFHPGDGAAAKLVADLGCGTGRALIPLVRRGFRGLAVDLSENMLQIVREKATQENLPIQCLRANLVELDCVADASIDYAMCLFSTFGMIRGRSHRQQSLRHIRRILKPGGLLVVHVHNYWYNLYDPGGPRWLVQNLFQSVFDPAVERGDKYFPYRGVANMFLHVFTRCELSSDVKQSGLQVREILPIDPRRMAPLRLPWLFGRLRAIGWLLAAERI